MKKLLLIFTLISACQYLRADDEIPDWDLFGMLGVNRFCETHKVQRAVTRAKDNGPKVIALAKAHGYEPDIIGYFGVLDRVGSILGNDELSDTYRLLEKKLRADGVQLTNPFATNMVYLTEMGIIQVSWFLDMLEEFLRGHSEDTSPSITIPPSPVTGRNSAESEKKRPPSRTEVAFGEEWWLK